MTGDGPRHSKRSGSPRSETIPVERRGRSARSLDEREACDVKVHHWECHIFPCATNERKEAGGAVNAGQEMRVDPSEPTCRSRFQIALSGCSQKLWS